MTEMHGTATGLTAAGGPPIRRGRRATPALPLTPARRAALVLGMPACLALTGFAGLSIVAQIGKGHFSVGYSFPASARSPSVTGTGDLELSRAAAGPARLSAYAYYSLTRPHTIERVSGDSATFGINCDFPVGDCGLDTTVSVPAGTAVTASTGGGDATVTAPSAT